MTCELSEPETSKVAAVIDGETLKLSDGGTVRLIGAKAPMPPLGFRGASVFAMGMRHGRVAEWFKAPVLKFENGRLFSSYLIPFRTKIRAENASGAG